MLLSQSGGGDGVVQLASVGLGLKALAKIFQAIKNANTVKKAKQAAEAAKKLGTKKADDVTGKVINRKAPGADGASSRHLIERNADGTTRSVTHQVVRDGKVIHQHQRHVGKYGSEKQFPSEWIKYPDVP